MSKKILFTSILSLFVLLIVGYFVVGDIGTIGIATKTTTTGSNSTVFKDNNNMVLNISISRSTGGDTLSNVTAFNVTLANDMTFIGYVSSCSSPGFAETIVNYSGSLNLGTIANTTCWSDGNAAGWSCYNRTATEIHCNTTHPGAALSAAGGHNSSIILRINVTTADLSTETQFTGFNITILDDGNIANFSLLNITRIDGQAPRITELNITDGNFTVFNGTDGNMNYGSFNLNPLNASNGIIVSSTAPLTITANIEDLLTEIGSLRLYYNTNVSKNPGNATVPHAENHTKYLTATKLSASSGNNSILYSWTIPADDLHDGAVMSFIIATNDTTNHQANLTGPGTVLTPFNLTINNTIPRILKWNITDGTNWVSNADGYLLDGTTYTMYIDVSGLNNSDTSKMYNQSVRIYYTNTTTGKVVWNETINANNALGHGLRELNFSNFSTFTPYGTNTWNAAIAASDIQLSNGNNMGFVIVVQENPLHYNYTTYAAGPGKDGFNITLDSTAPIGITLTTTDADSIVETSGSITYTCAATDALSGVNSYKFILDKPGQASAVTNAYSTTASATYTGSQTNAAGTYTLHCYVKDNVGNEGSTTATFNAQYGSGGSSSSSGGGGGSSGTGATTVTTATINLAAAISEKVTISQGTTKTFTLDGVTAHSMTINEVTATSVKITISSDPITIELTLGESKLIDLDKDGTNDIKVTLNKITGTNADVTIEKLQVTTPAKETPKTTDSGAVGTTEPTTEKAGVAWLWWLIGLIIIIVIAWIVLKKKK